MCIRDRVSDVPTSGYNLYPLAVDSYINSIVALKLASGKYAVIKIENWTSSSSGSLDIATLTFSYKYQTNGSNRF
ncbi:MAG: hypothetical protein N2491_06170, partial [Negativicutes bacterium]|nr:hypothetical protein [Negativicutes bacterium]